jgi:hypothetical protein
LCQSFDGFPRQLSRIGVEESEARLVSWDSLVVKDWDDQLIEVTPKHTASAHSLFGNLGLDKSLKALRLLWSLEEQELAKCSRVDRDRGRPFPFGSVCPNPPSTREAIDIGSASGHASVLLEVQRQEVKLVDHPSAEFTCLVQQPRRPGDV